MKELPENNNILMEKNYKIKVDFLFPYEGYKEEPLAKQNKAENCKSSLLGSIEKKAKNQYI